MNLNLHDYQRAASDDCVEFLNLTAGSVARRLYSAPTGSGKSYIELDVLQRLAGGFLVTPRLEIIKDMMAKWDGQDESIFQSQSALLEAAQSVGIWTPVRLRNRLIAGRLDPPRYILVDEGHHDLCETLQQVHLMCQCPAAAFTATPFRGTPKGTAKLRELWGEPKWIITLVDAVARGVVALPRCETMPLVDDDLVEVANGEFVVTEVETATLARMQQLVQESYRRFYRFDRWDVPTMYAAPTVECARQLATALNVIGAPANLLVGETPWSGRGSIFAAAQKGEAALVQVAVVGEGVDLPQIRRLVDLAPYMSPVRWLQQLGRVTRPGEVEPHYLCCNRNLLRHGYLLDGVLPPSQMIQAQQAFPERTRGAFRSNARALGMEAIGRFKGIEVPLKSGLRAQMYALSCLDGHRRTDYVAIVHPLKQELFWAKTQHERAETGEYKWGRWAKCAPPEDLSGFNSVPPKSVSEKQMAWWERCAARHGLEPDVDVTRKLFQVLPVLSDTKTRLG